MPPPGPHDPEGDPCHVPHDPDGDSRHVRLARGKPMGHGGTSVTVFFFILPEEKSNMT